MKKIEYDWDIYTLRKKLSISQKNFSRVLNVDITTIKNWEHRRHFPPRIGQLFLTILNQKPELLDEYITEKMKNTFRAYHGEEDIHGEEYIKEI